MRGLFPQYDDSPSQDYGVVWKSALFVFDTNVLLNLYRYQAVTRDELIKVLTQLSGQIWIPHHVALEFQRNRLKVIAEQNRRFAEVRRTIEKAQSSLLTDLEKLQLHKRHSLINPQALTIGFQKLVTEFLAELDQLQESQQKVSAPDLLKKKLEALFENRVGTPPSSQQVLDELYKEAETRFKIKIPPGYQDSEKDKNEPDEHIHGGIIYKRKYGDFLIWKQLLEYSKSANAKSIVFVTDDGKEDWWRKIESDGPKTIGPRPELVEEAKANSNVETLLMYNPEGFLKYAIEFLKAQVSDETLKEVRDISTIRSARDMDFHEFRWMAIRAEQSVYFWLKESFDIVHKNKREFPDFIVELEGKDLGFEIVVVRNPSIIINQMKDVVNRACYKLKENDFSEITIVWVVSGALEVEEFKRKLVRLIRDWMPENLWMIIGVVDDPETGGVGFVPYDKFSCNEAINFFQGTTFGGR